MKFTDEQIAWLKKARSRDITKIFSKKDMKFDDKMKIHKKWLELHNTKFEEQKLADKWANPKEWE